MDKRVDINRVNEALAVMLAQELHQYCMEGENRTISQTSLMDYFTEPQQERIHEIGEFLNEVGGCALMLAVGEALPFTGRKKVDHLWSGIGKWQA